MIQRNEVVLSVLRELQEATEISGLDVLTKVALEVDRVLTPFQLPRTPCYDFPEWAGVDDVARGLYPADAPVGLLPLKCNGEGNVLFDAVSMLLVGSTALSLELQVRSCSFYNKNVFCLNADVWFVIRCYCPPTGADCGGDGVVETLLLVWDD